MLIEIRIFSSGERPVQNLRRPTQKAKSKKFCKVKMDFKALLDSIQAQIAHEAQVDSGQFIQVCLCVCVFFPPVSLKNDTP
jgi:hypothetical protein